MVSSLRHRKTLVHVCISPFIPMLQASLHLLESRYIVADLVGFHRPALEVLHVFVILFFPGFYGQKNKKKKNRIGSCILCLQNRTIRWHLPDWNCLRSLSHIFHVRLLPGLEGNDVEGTLGRGTFPVPSISSRLWSNSSWTSSSSSASRSSWQQNWSMLARILLVATSHSFPCSYFNSRAPCRTHE